MCIGAVAATQEGTRVQDTHLPKEGPVHKDFLQKAHARGRVDLIQKHLHEACTYVKQDQHLLEEPVHSCAFNA